MKNLPIIFEKDYTENQIKVSCMIDVAVNEVWNAFTTPEILEKWLAPEPYLAITKEMDFVEGGKWLYYMLSPQGEKYWGISIYSNIRVNESFDASDAFCDEKGIINTQLPRMYWYYRFSEDEGKTLVSVTIIPRNKEEMEQILEMGFEEGYKMSLLQLQRLLT